MRIAIVGAGAVGGLLGWRLARQGHEVGLLARGATLAALRAHGLRLRSEGRDEAVAVRASDDPSALGPQDLVVLAVKSQALPGLAPALPPLLDASTVVLSAMNGVPWWFFEGLGGPCQNLSLASVDPDGALAQALPASRVLGGVLHLSASCPEPGVVTVRPGPRVIVGEPSGAPSARLERVAQVLQRAGFEVEVSERIQRDIWFKLWGNMTLNPLSALIGSTTDRLLDDPLVRAFVSRCMEEARAIGARIGIPIDTPTEERHAVTRRLGAFKTSMLQDVEAGRTVELDALVGAVREIAQHLALPTPSIDTLFGLARLHARVRGLYPAA